MLEFYHEFLCKPLEVIFQLCLEKGKFPYEWKNDNGVPGFTKVMNKN